MMRIDITDHAAEGADAPRESSLSDIEHRLAAFDGVLAVNRVPGGPIIMSIEVPSPLL